MNVSLEVKLSHKLSVVVKTKERLYGFYNRHSGVWIKTLAVVQSLPNFQLSDTHRLRSLLQNTLNHSDATLHILFLPFVSGRKVRHFEGCATFLYLNDKD